MWWSDIQFELLEVLGEGSQGRVYKALRRDRRTGLSQLVALKVLHSRTAIQIWRDEFESLARMRSPYCVNVLSFERYKGRPALVLEYVDGVSVSELGRGLLLSEQDVSEILAQLETALLDLQRNGLFHGDLSPHNILIDNQGRVRVLDFGIANSSVENRRVTPEFAAPERLTGGPATFASDLFSLGRVERYLRGQKVEETGPNESAYLHWRPDLRRLQNLAANSQRQTELAEKIKLLMVRRRSISKMRTRSQLLVNQLKLRRPDFKRDFALGLMTVLGLFALTGTAAKRPANQWATLNLRTSVWHRFALDGQDLGYSPLSITLDTGKPHELSWDSAHGQGKKRLQMKAFATTTLSDRDFSH